MTTVLERNAYRAGWLAAVKEAVGVVRYNCDCKHADIPGLVELLAGDDPIFGYKSPRDRAEGGAMTDAERIKKLEMGLEEYQLRLAGALTALDGHLIDQSDPDMMPELRSCPTITVAIRERKGREAAEAKLAEATDIIGGLVRAYSHSEAAPTEERLTAISRGVLFLVPGAPEPPLPAAQPGPDMSVPNDRPKGRRHERR